MPDSFPTTRPSAVLGLGSQDPALRERSFAGLAGAYWKPAYKHVRVKWRASAEDAEDTVQAFFARSQEKEFFAAYQPSRARFRTFFRVCLDRFASNEAKALARQKRGGALTAVAVEAEQELDRAGASAWESPEDCFDREWRRHLLARAIDALRASCAATGKDVVYRVFERYDLADPDERPTYDVLGRELGLPATTVTNHLAFARRELRRLAVAMLEEITAGDAELRDETRTLFD